MSAGSAAALPVTTLDDDAWEDLLSFIEERRVIPIVGPELLQVSTDRGPRLLLDWVAERINLERFGGAPSTDVLSYAPNRVADLPSERDRLERPLRDVRLWRERIHKAQQGVG